MKRLIKNKMELLIIIFTLIIVGIFIVVLTKTMYAYQSIYNVLPENSIIIGNTVFEGYVGPNSMANAAIDYYKETENKDILVYKYNGLDEDDNPIWSKYSSEKLSYVELTKEEIKKVEDVVKDIYD